MHKNVAIGQSLRQGRDPFVPLTEVSRWCEL
jgi:hypothetical protein